MANFPAVGRRGIPRPVKMASDLAELFEIFLKEYPIVAQKLIELFDCACKEPIERPGIFADWRKRLIEHLNAIPGYVVCDGQSQ